MSARTAGIVLWASLGISSVAMAQFAEDRPRLIVNPGGPAGLVWKLGFSPDSRALYAAGTDKSAHLWHVRREQERPRATYLRGLRWEIARGFRGVLYAMDLSPKGDLIAVAGVSARQGGDIILFDAATGEIARSLPPVRDDAISRPGHLDTVVTLAFSPDGQRLVSVDKSGEILLWSAPQWTPQTLRPAIPQLNETQQPAVFLDPFTVAAAQPGAAGQPWSVVLYDIRVPDRAPQPLPQPHVGRVTALAKDPRSDQWASADRAGAIYLWNGANAPKPNRIKQGERVPTALTFGPGNRLAAGNEQDGNGQTVVELWDIAGRNRLEQIATSSFQHNPPIAFSPDGNWFAAYSPNGHEVLLYSLQGMAQGQRPMFHPPALLRLRGRGQTFRTVVFEQGDSHRIAVGDEQSVLRSAFDLRTSRLYPDVPADAVWRKPTEGNGGWTLSVDATRTVLSLQNAGLRADIRLDRVRQGILTSHAWITDAAKRPIAVAIGTDEQNGIFLYRLPQRAGETAELVRYFRDHAGNVTSLAASSDGKLLASVSEDQTVKIWSLGELLAGHPLASWGAEFAVAPNGVTVTRALPPGIATSRDLKPGDVITQVTGANRVAVNAPAALLQALHQNPLFQQMTVLSQRAGAARPPIQIVPGWEPMATLFIDRRNEWALWTPQGFYDSSAAEGDELFGWQINRGPGRTPRLVTAANLRREFERPELLQKLFAVGSLPEAFVALNEPPPASLETIASDVLKTLPEVSVVSPQWLTDFPAQQPVRVRAEAILPAGQTDALYDVHGAVDGIPLGTPALHRFDPAQNRLLVEWNSVPPDRLSRFHVRLERKPQGKRRGVMFAEAGVAVTADVAPQQKFRLHVLAFAASKYQGGAFPPLNYSVKDAETVISILKEREGVHYTLAAEDVTVVQEHDLSPAKASAAIGEMEAKLAKAGRDDLLVVILAGHGHATESDYYFIPPNVTAQDNATLAKSAIAWTQLQRIAEIRCRKLFLLDTCRSGDILDQKASIRPLKQAECLVFAATSSGGIALEGAQYGNHGAFTASLMAGLAGKADGTPSAGVGRPPEKDGDVSFFELLEFVKNDVARATGQFQYPTYTPFELMETLGESRLVRPLALGGAN